MKREALVVGINRYPTLIENHTDKPPHLKAPAADAEAIAQILESYGDFHVQRLPVHSQDGVWRVDSHQPVTVKDLKEAIVQLFNPPSKLSIPDTALLFFAGHGLRDNQGGVPECFLATSDCCTPIGQWGLSLDWLRKLLQSSPVRQQIVWLDCCYSGGLLNFDEADPGNLGKALDRCLISACRDFEVGYEQLQGEHGILTAALLQSLDPERHVDGWVTNYKLADYINKQMSRELQRPVFHNSGGAIILTDKTNGERQQVDPNLVGKCPYKSLNYFTQEDAVFFYGRTALTDELIDKVRTENFIAVLGASGSGKSSVLRAGLLYQLKRGQKLSGSDRWKYYDPFTPGEHPFESLQNAIGGSLVDLPLESGIERWVEQLTQLIASLEHERVVLVVDQFEECFTMCQGSEEQEKERERFFACLLGAVEQSKNKLCLVLGMRADFLGRCAEYGELAHKIDQHLVTVKPMTRTEIEEAISKPAELVGLQVEKALVTKMTGDVVGSPGSLPLLQYTLTELWNQAQSGSNRNWLQLNSYEVLGGIEGTLPKRANEVYQNLPPEQQPVAKRIFLELTQIGEISDSRRRVFLEDLINKQHSWQLLSEVKDRLVAGRLITADAISSKDASNSQKQEQKVLLDIVHESLIRHWQELRQWVEKHQVALEIERRIEARARGWSSNGKIDDPGLLLKGATLTEAEVFLQEYGDLGLLDGVAEEYIKFSQDVRDREEEDQEKQIAQLKQALTESQLREQSARVLNLLPVQPLEGLVLAIQTMGLNLDNLPADALNSVKNLAKYPGKILGSVQHSLHIAMDIGRVSIPYPHRHWVYCVAFSPDGQYIVSGSEDKTVRLWNLQGNPVGQPFQGHDDAVLSVAFSPDGQYVVSGSEDKTVRLWNLQGHLIRQLFQGYEDFITSVAFSPDGQYIVSGSNYGTLRLWDIEGNPHRQSFQGHEYFITSVAFSPDGQYIVSGSRDNTVRLWDIEGNPMGQPFQGHDAAVNSVAFSPDGQIIVSGSRDETVRLWDIEGNPIGQPFQGHDAAVNSVAFSPDGQMIVTGSDDKTVRLWDIEGNPQDQPFQVFQDHQNSVYSVAFSPDGQYIVSGSRDSTLRLWDIECNPQGQSFQGHEGHVNSVAFRPDGQMVVSGSDDETVRLWGIDGNPICQPFKGHNDAVNSVAFSPDGQMVVSGSDDETVRLWDVDGNPIRQPFNGHYGAVNSVAFSPDGQMVVSGSEDRTVRLWNIEGNPIGQPFKGHDAAVNSVAFSPDGQYIISGSRDNTVSLWDIKGNPIGQSFKEHRYFVNSVAFSPDGQMIITASEDKTLRLWDIKGNPIGQPFRGHEYSVSSVAFSPDGQRIVSGSSDNTLRLWDLQGNPIGQPLQGHKGSVSSVAFSADGQMIITGSEDKTLRLWRGSWQADLQVCCDRLRYHPVLKNPQTDVEKQAYETCQKYVWSSRPE
jgi:WD40 repeat protein